MKKKDIKEEKKKRRKIKNEGKIRKELKSQWYFFTTMTSAHDLTIESIFGVSYCIDLDELGKRLSEVVLANPDNLEAHLTFVLLEARGEVLPYFFEIPKTALGYMLQGIECVDTYTMFTSERTQEMFKSTFLKLMSEDGEYRAKTYAVFDSEVRSYSLTGEVDLIDLLYGGKDEQTIAELRQIEQDSLASKRSVADTIAMGYIHIVGKQNNAIKYFKAEEGRDGLMKRQAQAKFTGDQRTQQEKVFKALLDYENYFEDRYEELNRILPQGAVNISVHRRLREKSM